MQIAKYVPILTIEMVDEILDKFPPVSDSEKNNNIVDAGIIASIYIRHMLKNTGRNDSLYNYFKKSISRSMQMIVDHQISPGKCPDNSDTRYMVPTADYVIDIVTSIKSRIHPSQYFAYMGICPLVHGSEINYATINSYFADKCVSNELSSQTSTLSYITQIEIIKGISPMPGILFDLCNTNYIRAICKELPSARDMYNMDLLLNIVSVSLTIDSHDYYEFEPGYIRMIILNNVYHKKINSPDKNDFIVGIDELLNVRNMYNIFD
jgi:hypothetical protein